MKKSILFLLFLGVFITVCQAMPARRRTVLVKQSDGTQLSVILNGDEFFHYYSTTDGAMLFQEQNGSFYYAVVNSEGGLASSGTLAHNAEKRNAMEQQFVAAHRFMSIPAQTRAVAKRNRANARRVLSREKDINTTGTVKIPVLLVNFSNKSFVISKTAMQNHFSGVNYTGDYQGCIGSARDYFIAQSDSQFIPDFTVFGPVTLSHTMAYYGANDSQGNDLRPEQMIIDACNGLNSSVDFSQFDNDGDGKVDFIYVVYAGYSEASDGGDNTIWPHQWTLTEAGKTLTLDGVKIDRYCCSSELYLNSGSQIDGIGSACHEFSHCLGLPDFYDTGDSKNFGLDYWSLMDYGCYALDGFCPIGYSSYEREIVGWKKIETVSGKRSLTLQPVNKGGIGYRIVNASNPNEWYILENRQQTGWDTYLLNHGMLIFHVDYLASIWEANTINNDKNHQRCTLMPADGVLLTYSNASSSSAYAKSLKGDPWPGTSGNTALTDSTTPAATVFTGSYMHQPITNIAEANGIITCRVNYTTLDAPAIDDNCTSDITTNGFKVTWKAVDGATSYNISLYKATPDGEADYTLVGTYSTAGTTFTFAGLTQDIEYEYYITAVNSTTESEWSNTIKVNLIPSGISTAEAVSFYSLQAGVLKLNVSAGTPIEVYRTDGRLEKRTTATGNAQELPLGNGLYILKIGSRVAKIMVR